MGEGTPENLEKALQMREASALTTVSSLLPILLCSVEVED